MCSYQLDSRQSSNLSSQDTSSVYFYKTEIEVKNRQIVDLKSRVELLLKEKNNLHSKVSNLQLQNYSINSSCEQEVKNQNHQLDQKEKVLNNQIAQLQNDNRALRYQLNIKEGTEDNFQLTFQNRISNAQKEVNNLGVMNTIKDNYLTQMVMFYNKLNSLCGEKYDYELDHFNDEVNVFKKRMKEIEDKVLMHIQFNNVHQNDNQFQSKEGKDGMRKDSNTHMAMSIDMVKNNNCKSNKNNSNVSYKYHSYCPEIALNMGYNNKLNEEKRKRYNEYSAGVRIYNNDSEEKKRYLAMRIKNSRLSNTRTPPRDMEYEPRE